MSSQAAVFSASHQESVTLVHKSQGRDSETTEILQKVFSVGEFPQETCGTVTELSDLRDHVSQNLDTAALEGEQGTPSLVRYANQADNGRIGPQNIVFDYKGNMGTLVIEADRLGLSSQSNFSSIRANVCVYKGRWVYELMLGSRGVMQLGWCTASCNFTQEEGVGDTEDSFAYDGNRQRKWTMKMPYKYGEVWLTGDVISCAIDCDEGTVSFYRNGRYLGEAFTNIRLGPGFAYFPAVSLSLSENVRANFGATPLRYPIDGYRPLQDPPLSDLLRSQRLFLYLEKIVPLLSETRNDDTQMAAPECPHGNRLPPRRSRKATLMLAAAHVFDKLAPLLKSPYVVEAGLLKFLLTLCEVQRVCGEHVLVHQCLDLIWAFMQESERKHCLEHLMASLISAYRFSPALPDFAYQLTFLVLLFAVLKHEKTRKFVIKNVLFDKIKFPTFLHVKPPDDEGLVEIIPDVCLDLGDRCPEKEDAQERPAPSAETLEQRHKYFHACRDLGTRVAELEYLQVEILKLLLINNDNTDGGASTRFVFLHKFREFLKENFPPTMRSSMLWLNKCPLSVSLCFFHRLIAAVRFYWDELYDLHPDLHCPSQEAFVPCETFYNDSINYFDIQRIGGLHSHLAKTYHEDIQRATLGADHQPAASHVDQVVRLSEDIERMQHQAQGSNHSHRELVELLDGAILLYSIAAHKQLAKMCSLRDTVHEYVDALEETNRKIEACPAKMREVREELQRSLAVFQEKGVEQTRQMAWVVGVIYAKDKQEDICWLLQTVLRTIERASRQNSLFSFVPDYYIDACIYAYQALRSFFHPTRPYTELPDFPHILINFATFLSDHFSDERIVNADCKDALVQALACFVCYPHSLKTLENISLDSRLRLTKALLAPYENRSWAQTNWILVRLWKGCGFGFRYTQLPHLQPSKGQQPEHLIRKPCPSLVFQGLVSQVLREDEVAAAKFLDTVLSQLNWAFSEFIGMLQELQSIAARPSAAFIDSRHLKICATCFDLSVGLLRLLEMITAIAPGTMTDWSKPHAEQLLCRLCQLLSQVLNRITSKSNTFDVVVAAGIPGLDTVDHFPILGAVCGILVQLLLSPQAKARECAIQALLAEPGFQVSCLEFLVGGGSDAESAPLNVWKTFSLKNYKEHVSEEEILKIEQLISFVKSQQQKDERQTTVVDEDSLCEICYARPKSVKFLPCEHQSCKSCITHQMMNKKECFFCKTPVVEVVDLVPQP